MLTFTALLVCVCAFFDIVASTPFQRRGNQTSIAANWNFTSTASAPSQSSRLVDGSEARSPTLPGTAITRPPYPSGTAFSSFVVNKTSSLLPGNSTAPPCTVNVPQANIDWWYLATYEWTIGTLRTVQGNLTEVHLSNRPNTATFNVTDALSYAYTETSSYDVEYDETFTWIADYTVKPTASVTSVVSRLGYSPLPPDNTVLESDLYLYTSERGALGPATIQIPGSNQTGALATSSAPFVFFSAYEVVSARPYIDYNGRLVDSTTTQTFTLPQPLVYPYSVKGIQNSVVATGTIPPEFLIHIPHASCSAGTLTGVVTVLVVVDVYYRIQPNANPFRVHIEKTASGWEDDPIVEIKETGPRPPLRTYEPTDIPIIKPGVRQTETPNEGSPSSTPGAPRPVDTTVGSVGAVPVVVGPNSRVVIGSQTLVRGSPPITVGGQVVSLDPSGDAVVVGGGRTSLLPVVVNVPVPTQHTVGSVGPAPVVIGPSSAVVVGSQTLTRGAPPITVGGVPVSLNPSGNAIVVGGSRTSQLPSVPVPGFPSPRPAPVLTIGISTFTGNAATQFFLRPGQTLVPGGTATLGGTIVSLDTAASFVVVGGSTQFVAPPPVPAVTPKPSIVVGGSTFTQISSSFFLIGSQTLRPNGEAVTVGSDVVSLGQNFAVVNQATSSFQNLAHAITLPHSTITAIPGGAFVVGGHVLAVSGPAITLNGGTTLSLAAPNIVVVNGVSSTLTNPSTITLPPSIITPNPDGQFIIAGQTLAVGGPAITIGEGTTLSLAASTVLVINGASSTFATPAAHITPPPLTIGNGVYTAAAGSGTTYMVGGQSLTPGGVITVVGTTISLAPGATALVINGETTTLTPPAPITNAPLLTIGSEIFTAIRGTTFFVHGQALTPGGSVIFDGTTVSLSPGATMLVYESGGRTTTKTLFPATTTRVDPAASAYTISLRPTAGATVSDSAPSPTTTAGAAITSRPAGFGVLLVFLLCFGIILG